MDLDMWVTYYRSIGYTINVEEDGGQPAWFVYNTEGEVVDWWWLSDSDVIRDLNDPFTPPDFTTHE